MGRGDPSALQREARMKAYYNDFDPFVCQWVRNLIEAGLISSQKGASVPPPEGCD